MALTVAIVQPQFEGSKRWTKCVQLNRFDSFRRKESITVWFQIVYFKEYELPDLTSLWVK